MSTPIRIRLSSLMQCRLWEEVESRAVRLGGGLEKRRVDGWVAAMSWVWVLGSGVGGGGNEMQAQASQPAGRVPQMAVQQLDTIKTRGQVQELPGAGREEEQAVPQLYPGESQDMGSQMLLRQKPKKNYFEAMADTQFSYSSNALLDSSNPKDAGIWATTISAAFAPEPFELGSGKVMVRSGYRHIMWIYDVRKERAPSLLNASNFMFETVFLSGRYGFAENWGLNLGLDYNRVLTGNGEWQWSRLVEFGNWKEAYTEWTPSWGLDRTFVLGSRASASVSYTGAYHFSDSDPTLTQTTRRWNDRLDNALMLSLMVTPTEQWLIQPFARVMHSAYVRSAGIDVKGEYFNGGNDSRRRDWNRSFGLNVMWIPNQRFSVRAFASGEFRNSNDPTVPDYSKFESGLGMSLNFRF